MIKYLIMMIVFLVPIVAEATYYPTESIQYQDLSTDEQNTFAQVAHRVSNDNAIIDYLHCYENNVKFNSSGGLNKDSRFHRMMAGICENIEEVEAKAYVTYVYEVYGLSHKLHRLNLKDISVFLGWYIYNELVEISDFGSKSSSLDDKKAHVGFLTGNIVDRMNIIDAFEGLSLGKTKKFDKLKIEIISCIEREDKSSSCTLQLLNESDEPQTIYVSKSTEGPLALNEFGEELSLKEMDFSGRQSKQEVKVFLAPSVPTKFYININKQTSNWTNLHRLSFNIKYNASQLFFFEKNVSRDVVFNNILLIK